MGGPDIDIEIKPGTTKPRPRFPEGYKVDRNELAHKRYGTLETVQTWGADLTIDFTLQVQGQASLTLLRLNPNVTSPNNARAIADKASIKYVSPARVAELEALYDHDGIAINTGLQEQVPAEAKSDVNKLRTTADSTQSAKAKQLKRSLEIIAESTENLRDIVIEKSIEWIDIPHMDQTHGFDALPTVAGRPLAHYVEMLQSGLRVLKFFYHNSIVGKWGDMTGNHHGATTVGVNGVKLQQEYCKDLGVACMDAAAQVPGLEFEADIVYSVARIGMSVDNLAFYMASGRGDDRDIFVYVNPTKKRKGSSGGPHKDAKGGNPIDEEQARSVANKLMGAVMTALANCFMPYARTLYGSANSRIDLEDIFKFQDHNIRRLAETIFYTQLKPQKSVDRVLRSHGVVTAPQVLTYLTTLVDDRMPWKEAHDLIGKIAGVSWNGGIPFADLLIKNGEVSRRLSEATIREITDPLKYIGQSKEIIRTVAGKYYQQKTLG